MTAIPASDIVTVIGAGTMGAGIAQIAAQAGHTVYLYDLSQDTIQHGIEHITKGLSRLVEKNKLSIADKEQLLNRIHPTTDIKQLSESRLIIEAIFEDINVKQKVLLELEELCGENTILASNTSSISITAIGSVLKRPQNLAGMHFFNPAQIMKLVEIVSGITTSPTIAETLFDTATAWGKKAVHVKSTPGFIVNRVARPYYAEALRALQEGTANIATIDAVMRESGGFRMGPFELMDMIGHDVNYAVTCSVFSAYYNDPRFLPSLLQKDLIDAGFLGRKTGRGFYDYVDENNNPKVDTLMTDSCPLEIIVYGEPGIEQSIIQLLKDNQIEYQTKESNSFKFIVNDVHIALTDGRTATERSAKENIVDLVLFDLALDFTNSNRCAITSSAQASAKAATTAIAFFNAIGKSVSVLNDVPGMLVMRTVCMLANEGADAVNQQVCNEQAVDTAMEYGVNYPLGPLAWAERIGLENVINVLRNLAQTYGEDRYRISPLLQKNAFAHIPFHDQ